MILRYIRAFWKALGMTLRGETPPRPPYAPLRVWIDEAGKLATAAVAAAEQGGMDPAARRAFTVRIEGRDMSLHTILETVRHHTGEEYPYLLRHLTNHSITAIYASNMNDQFYVARLADDDRLAGHDLLAALARLRDHLHQIPSTNSEV